MNPMCMNIVNPILNQIHIAQPWRGEKTKGRMGGMEEGRKGDRKEGWKGGGRKGREGGKKERCNHSVK